MILRHPAVRARRRAAITVGLLAVALSVPAVYSLTAQAHHGLAARASIATVVSRFALLRNPGASPPPPGLVSASERAPAGYGLDIQAARQAANGTWLVPGTGWLCLATTDDEGLGMSCATAAAAERGELSFSQRTAGDGEEQIVGAAPDGYTKVGAVAGGGDVASSPILESTYTLSARNVSRVTLGQAP